MSPTIHQSPLKMNSKVGSGNTPNGGGGISRAFRGICGISVATSEPPADIKCQFSA